MQTTTNFGLKEYESGDYFNPLTVENYNTGKIDTEMKAVADKTIGRATELVSGGVHAITLLDTDCKTFQFTATGNYTALETFTLNGIAINAYMPDGSALTTDAYKTGAVVICSRNSDDSALTFYLSSVGGVAPDSLKLGGELPAYYATKSYADGIKTTADTASELIQKKALVNTYWNSSTGKLYEVNANGTQGSEIKIGSIPILKYSAPLHTFSSGNLTYTATKDCYLLGTFPTANSQATVTIDGTVVVSNGYNQYGNIRVPMTTPIIKIKSGSTVVVSQASDHLHIYEEA